MYFFTFARFFNTLRKADKQIFNEEDILQCVPIVKKSKVFFSLSIECDKNGERCSVISSVKSIDLMISFSIMINENYKLDNIWAKKRRRRVFLDINASEDVYESGHWPKHSQTLTNILYIISLMIESAWPFALNKFVCICFTLLVSILYYYLSFFS